VRANLYPHYADLLENRFASAVGPFKATVQAFQKADDFAGEIYGHLYLGEILAAMQRHDEAVAEFMAAALPSSGNMVMIWIPMGDYRWLLTAEICLARREFAASSAALDKTSGWAKLTSSRYHKISADLAMQAGDGKKAIEEYGYFKTNKMATNTSYLMADPFYYLEVTSRLDYYLGQIYEKMGDSASAAEYYRKFLDLMKNADPGIKEIDDARRRLAGLKDP